MAIIRTRRGSVVVWLLVSTVLSLTKTFHSDICQSAEAATCTAASSPGGTFTDPTSTFVGCTITGWADFDFGSVASTAVALSLLVSGSTVQAGQRLSIAGFAGLTAHQPLNATIVDSTFSNSALRIAGTFPSGTTITILRTTFALVDTKLFVGQNTLGPPAHFNPLIFFSTVVLRDGSALHIVQSTLSNIKNAASQYNIVTFHSPLNTDLTLSNHSAIRFEDTTLLARSQGADPMTWDAGNFIINARFEGIGNTVQFLRCNMTGHSDAGHTYSSVIVVFAPSTPAAFADPPLVTSAAAGRSTIIQAQMPPFTTATTPTSPIASLAAAGVTATSALIVSGCRIVNHGNYNGFGTRFALPPGTFALFENNYVYGFRGTIFGGQTQNLIVMETTQNISILMRGNTFDATTNLMREAILIKGPAWQSFNLILYRNRALLNNNAFLLLNPPALPVGVTSTSIAVHMIENTVTGVTATARPLLQGYAAPHETVYVCRNTYFGNRLVVASQYLSGTGGVTDVGTLAALRYNCGSETLSLTQTGMRLSASTTLGEKSTSPSTSAAADTSNTTSRGPTSTHPPDTVSGTINGTISTSRPAVTDSAPISDTTARTRTAPSTSASVTERRGTPSASAAHRRTGSWTPATKTLTPENSSPATPSRRLTTSPGAPTTPSATASREFINIQPTRSPPICPPHGPEPSTATHAWLILTAPVDNVYRAVFVPPPLDVDALQTSLTAPMTQQTIQWNVVDSPAQPLPQLQPLPAAIGQCTLEAAAITSAGELHVTCTVAVSLVQAIVGARPDRTTTVRTTVFTGPCGRSLALVLFIQPTSESQTASVAVVIVVSVAIVTTLLTAIVDPTAIDAQLITVVLLSACSLDGGAARVSRYLLSPLIDLGPAVVALAHAGVAFVVTILHCLAAVITARRRKISFSAACHTVHFPSASFSLSSVLYAGAAWGTAAAIHNIGTATAATSSMDILVVVCAVCLFLVPEPVLCAFALLRTAARFDRFASPIRVRECNHHTQQSSSPKSLLARLCLPTGVWVAWRDVDSEGSPSPAVGSLRGLAGPRAPLLHILFRLQFLLCCALITAPPQSKSCKGRLFATAAVLALSAAAVIVTRPFRVHATTALSAALALSTALLAAASAVESNAGGLTNAAIVLASVCAVLRGAHTAVVLVWEHRTRQGEPHQHTRDDDDGVAVSSNKTARLLVGMEMTPVK